MNSVVKITESGCDVECAARLTHDVLHWGRNQVLYLVATSERTVQMAREKLCLVDIGASGIKLCQLRRQRDEIALEHFAQALSHRMRF